jgi:signal transduction histidine kinase
MRRAFLFLFAAGFLLMVGVAGLVWPAPAPADAWRAAFQPIASVDLSSWLPDRPELLDPRTAMPFTHRAPRAALAWMGPCEGEGRRDERPVPEGWEKLVAWQRSLCDATPLPPSSLLAPPWMHPSGSSYSELADGPEASRHVLERDLPAPLGELAPVSLLALVEGHSAVVGLRWVLVRSEARVYAAAPRAAVDRRLALRGLRVADDCEGSPTQCLEAAPRTAAWPFLGLGLLGLALGGWQLRRRAQQLARERRENEAFLLRTLTHELRTPAAAIGLELEPVRRHFEALPEPVQEAFLRLTAANQDLQRTLSVTSTYLSLERDRPRQDLELCRLSALAEELEVEADVGVLEVRADRDWLLLALGNLVANARQHGALPVKLSASSTQAGTRISVTDGGTVSADLDALSRAFERGPDSQGLGLGLAITSRVAGLLGGRLTLDTNPTCFTLELPNP